MVTPAPRELVKQSSHSGEEACGNTNAISVGPDCCPNNMSRNMTLTVNLNVAI